MKTRIYAAPVVKGLDNLVAKGLNYYVPQYVW